jgi:hypothetical protein
MALRAAEAAKGVLSGGQALSLRGPRRPANSCFAMRLQRLSRYFLRLDSQAPGFPTLSKSPCFSPTLMFRRKMFWL